MRQPPSASSCLSVLRKKTTSRHVVLLGSFEANSPRRHSGIATVYTQGGVAGSCGNVNSDSSVIVALGNFWMKNEFKSPFCGRLIQVTNTAGPGKGNVVVAKVQDTCEGCDENHVDFSVGGWNKLTNSAAFGVVNIDWYAVLCLSSSLYFRAAY